MSHQSDTRFASLVSVTAGLIFLLIVASLMGDAILSNPGISQLLRVLGGAQ